MSSSTFCPGTEWKTEEDIQRYWEQVNVGDKAGGRSVALRIKVLSKTQGKHILEWYK